MRQKSIYIVLLSFVCLSAYAQNLVPNHSFENAWSCPEDYQGYAVKNPFPGWINPNNGTPDQVHACSQQRAGVPENFAGYMYPYDGNGYAGIILREKFDDSLKVYRGVSREYIQTKLESPLEKDKLYCVKFYYVNAKKSMFSVNALGITLTLNQISSRHADLIIQQPQVKNSPDHMMTEMDDWVEFCGYYRAGGGEQYLTIGNFMDNVSTQYVLNNNEYSDSAFFYAYYLIDDVHVFEIGDAFECGCLNNLAWSCDWMAPDFDPATGYNTRLIADSGDDGNGINDGGDSNGKNLGEFSNGTGFGQNGNENSGDSGMNGNNSGTGKDVNLAGANATSRNSDADERDVAGLKTRITREAFDRAEIGDRFRLNQIYFEFNSAELLPISNIQLDSLFQILNAKTTLRIEIRGHTDNIGNENYNKKLSVDRAASVYNYLLAKGIPKARMKYRGFGSLVPVADNRTDEGRELNRRVEILIVEL